MSRVSRACPGFWSKEPVGESRRQRSCGASRKLRGEQSQVRPGGGRKCPQGCSGQQD